MRYYDVIVYNNFNKMNRKDIIYLQKLFFKLKNRFYFEKGIIDGYNIAFKGLSNLNDAKFIKRYINRILYKYRYSEYEFHFKFSKLGDVNYTGKCKKNLIEIVRSKSINYFENESQYLLFRWLSIKMDNLFFREYFKEKNSLLSIYKYVFDEYSIYNLDERLINSHISHLLSFVYNLNYNDKLNLLNSFKKYQLKKMHLNYSVGILQNLMKKIEKMLRNEEINFYSPSSLEEMRSKKIYASEQHKKTLFNDKFQNEIIYDKYRISNRWFLNVLYRKLIIMNYNLGDKYLLNYLLSLNSSEIDINQVISRRF